MEPFIVLCPTVPDRKLSMVKSISREKKSHPNRYSINRLFKTIALDLQTSNNLLVKKKC